MTTFKSQNSDVSVTDVYWSSLIIKDSGLSLFTSMCLTTNISVLKKPPYSSEHFSLETFELHQLTPK